MPDTTRDWPLPRGLIVLLGTGAAVLAIGGAKAASSMIGPIFLALVLTVAIHPLRGYLISHRWPPWAGTLAVILAAYAVLVAIVVALLYAVAKFATILPRYADDLNDLVKSAGGALDRAGVGQDQLKQMEGAFDADKLVSLVGGVLSGLVSTASGLFFLGILLLFLAIDAAQFPDKLARQREGRGAVVSALESFARGTRRYLVVATVFGFIVAVLDTVFLSFTPIPAPVLWGLLAFITNYIPNIGFVVGLVPPALLGLFEGGPGLMVLVIVVYSVINAILQSVIQPRVVGEAVGLSGTISFVSLMFWAWVLGPVGALFAVPLTLLVKAFLIDADRETAWLGPLIDGSPALPATEPRPGAADLLPADVRAGG
ncbi:MAG: AI-2E family transporter [Nocardioidaceae bacterium]